MGRGELFPTRGLAYLIQHAVARVVHLQSFLKEIDFLSDDADKNLVAFFDARVDDALSELSPLLEDLPDLVAPSNRLDARGLRATLDQFFRFNAFYRVLHYQFRLFTFFPRVHPEVQLLLDDVYDGSNQRPEYSVGYYEQVNFGKLDLQTHFAEELGTVGPTSPKQSKGIKVILLLPYLTRDDPLMWVNLVHELGHVCERELGIADKEVGGPGPPDEFALTRNWFTEHFADALSIRLAGPAYLAGFIEWMLSLAWNEQGPRNTHPSPVTRVRAMQSLLRRQQLDLSGATFLCDLVDGLTRFYGIPDTQLPTPLIPRKKIILASERAVDNSDYDIPFRQKFFNHVQRRAVRSLAAHFDLGIPVSTRPARTDQEVQKAVAKLASKRSQTRADLDIVADYFEQIANEATVILNVGWEHRLSTRLDSFISIFASRRGTIQKKLESYVADSVGADAKVRKSLETARIYKAWKEAEARLK